jgi:hypothetical protein
MPQTAPRPIRSTPAAFVVSLLTLFCLLVHGYHPFAEDGGLYVAGIRKLLDPSLYPAWTQFVTEHLRFSLFAPLVTGLVRATHLPLAWMLLLLYLASLWATLAAGWMVIARVTGSRAARCGAVSLLACWLTIPIAGTSLMLMDPYVTARSFSTPLALAAIAWAFDLLTPGTNRRRSALLCLVALLAAALVHPLMAGYAVAAVVVLLTTGSANERVRRHGPWLLAVLALLLANFVEGRAPTESANYVWIVMTRYYWFPFRWEWYEQIGLIAPLLVLLALMRGQTGTLWQTLIRATIVLGLIALAVALCFARAHMHTHLVARLQPLRCFQFVYEIMALTLGAWLGEAVLGHHRWRWAVLFAGFAGLMLFVERSTFPASAHLELPFSKEAKFPVNPWVRAFLWARDHTPKNALFALDAHYITRDGEDAQCFRAIAERSALPDYSKDGGEASITPSLTEAWVTGQHAQTGLDAAADVDRLGRLKPLAVTWVVLKAPSVTSWDCPYRNEAVKVCRLP